MRILVIGLALLAAGVALYIAVTRAMGRALDSSMRGLSQVAREVVDSVKVDSEHMNTWPPILWRGDTIGRLVAVGRIQYGSRSDRSILLYRALLTGHPPAYQPDSLAAIDSTDDARFAHELRIIPLHSLDSTRRHIGQLQFEATNEAIPVMAAVAPPQPTAARPQSAPSAMPTRGSSAVSPRIAACDTTSSASRSRADTSMRGSTART
jgi:hypothetical protein